MHTRSLAVLKRQVRDESEESIFHFICATIFMFEFLDFTTYDMQLIRKKMVKSAKECIKMQASNSEIYGKMQAVFIEMDTSPAVSVLHT